jgi:hypothetical protein
LPALVMAPAAWSRRSSLTVRSQPLAK